MARSSRGRQVAPSVAAFARLERATLLFEPPFQFGACQTTGSNRCVAAGQTLILDLERGGRLNAEKPRAQRKRGEESGGLGAGLHGALDGLLLELAGDLGFVVLL